MLIFAFPAILIYSVQKDWNKADKSWRNLNLIEKRFGAVFEDLAIEKGPKLLILPSYFMFRRLILSVIVVVFKEFLWMQIFLKAMSIIAAVIILGENKYFKTSFKRKIELTNEILVMFMLYNMICFSSFVPDL